MWKRIKSTFSNESKEEQQKSAATSNAARQEWIDLPTIMASKDLQWRAKTLVRGLTGGLNRSPKHGFSVEFSEFRPYTFGNDPSEIDWKVFARSDRYFIKKFEDETNRRCYVLLDKSQSMQFGSIEYSKLDYATTAAATLGYFFLRQRDAVGLMTFTDQIESFLPAHFRSNQLRRFITDCEREPNSHASGFAESISQVHHRLRPRSVVIVISDFLAPIVDMNEPLAQLAARGHEVVLLRVLDPKEIDFDIGNSTLIEDLETGETLTTDAALIQSRYRENFGGHAVEFHQQVESQGIRLLTAVTTQPIEQPLLAMIRGVEFAEDALTTPGISETQLGSTGQLERDSRIGG